MEVLVAAGVGTIMIVGAVTIIAPALKGSSSASATMISVGLAKELIEYASVWSQADWANIASVSTSTEAFFYLSSTSTPFVATSGIETISVGTSTYIRYFSVSDVYRDSGGLITASGGASDPSTKKITVFFGPERYPTSSMSTYVTRSRHKIYQQTDWSGESGVSGPVTSTVNSVYDSDNLDFTTSTFGSATIDGF